MSSNEIKRRSRSRVWLGLFAKIFLLIILIGLILPSHLIIPVHNATPDDWNRQSFWYYPWGDSGVHKGIDIFAPKGTDVIAPIAGIVLAATQSNKGGKTIYLLGPKWRVYYFAHLDTFFVGAGKLVTQNSVIGKVGNSGNAGNKASHLHFSIYSIIPHFWEYNHTAINRYEKMFYLNPDSYLN
jgi:peptidoglycan LD-endopeptidase LytH